MRLCVRLVGARARQREGDFAALAAKSAESHHLYYTKRTNYSPISQFSFFKTVFSDCFVWPASCQ